MAGFGRYGSGRRTKSGSAGRTEAGDSANSAGRRKNGSRRNATASVTQEELLIKKVEEAEVIAVEAHPKQPGMYRVAIKLYGESNAEDDIDNGGAFTGDGSPDGEAFGASATIEPWVGSGTRPSDEPENWNEEVDMLIAGAARATAASRDETVVTVHEDTLVAMRLLKGRRLSAEEWESLRGEEAREDAYRASLNILERKARTSRELSDALKRKGYSPDVIQSCLERLQARRMLDDSSYARRYTEQRATGQRKGRRLIRQELLQRGIAKEDADKALEELDDGVELEAAAALARKKWPQLKGELRERKMKLAAFLLRRGYPNGVVRSATDRVLAESELSEDRYGDDDAGDDIPDWDDAD